MTNSPLLRRRCKASLDSHRRRAARDKQQLDYTVEDLVALVLDSPWCTYCFVDLTPATFSFDHLMPTCRTGNYTLRNLALACQPCNEKKGALSASEFRALLALIRDWNPGAASDLLARLRAGGKRRREG